MGVFSTVHETVPHLGACLIATVLVQLIGMLWFSDTLFGVRWRTLTFPTQQEQQDMMQRMMDGMARTWIILMIFDLFTALIMAHIAEGGHYRLFDLVMFATIADVCQAVVSNLFAYGSWELVWINHGYWAANLFTKALLIERVGF